MAIPPISNSTLPQYQSPQQVAQSGSPQPAVRGGHHHHGGKKGGQSASATSGASGTLVFDPATGSMQPIGSVSTAADAKAAGSIDVIA